MKLKSICLFTLIATIVSTAPAFAQDLSATYLRIEPGVSIKGTYDGTNFRFVESGLSQFEGFEAFCVEPLQGVTIGEVVDYEIGFDYATPEVAASISKLVGNFYSSGMTANEAAATQWAIWEVVVDGTGGSLLTGNAQLKNNAIAGLGNTYLNQLPDLPVTDVRFLTNPTRQDMVSLNAIPEPASLSLFALSSVLLFRRRR